MFLLLNTLGSIFEHDFVNNNCTFKNVWTQVCKTPQNTSHDISMQNLYSVYEKAWGGVNLWKIKKKRFKPLSKNR